MCFDSGICILHMRSLFTHARPEERGFVAHPDSKATWTTNREETEGLLKIFQVEHDKLPRTCNVNALSLLPVSNHIVIYTNTQVCSP